MLCDIESAPGHKNIGIYKLPDGRLITCENSEQNPWEYGFREIDINSKSLINKTDFNWLSSGSGSTYLFSGGGDCDLIYYDLKDLYGYNLKTGVSERLINWGERELYDFEVYDSALNPPRVVMTGDIVHLVYVEYDNNGVSSATLSELKIAGSERLEQTNKKEIKLSALYLDGGTLETIADFNKRSKEYYINAKVYTNEASPTFDDELKQFNMDLLSGALPDFIFLDDNMPIESYINKGLFADLYEFIDDDPDMERTDYLPNILSALERNGGLYTCVTSFGVSTVVGKTSDVGKTPGWTWDEFNALLSKKPSGVIPFGYEFSYFTKRDFLDAVVGFNMNNFVDFKTSKADFSGGFINLLKTANGLRRTKPHHRRNREQHRGRQSENFRVNIFRDRFFGKKQDDSEYRPRRSRLLFRGAKIRRGNRGGNPRQGRSLSRGDRLMKGDRRKPRSPPPNHRSVARVFYP
jgi:hypothetical protein